MSLPKDDPALTAWIFAKQSSGYRVAKVAAMAVDAFPQRWECFHDTLPRSAFIATGDARSYEMKL